MGVFRLLCLLVVSFGIIVLLLLLGLQVSLAPVLQVDYYDSVFNSTDFYGGVSSLVSTADFFLFSVPSSTSGVRLLVLGFVDSILSYLKGDKDRLELWVEVDTVMLKNFFVGMIDALPLCASSQTLYNGSVLTCRTVDNSSDELLYSLLDERNLTSLLDSRQYNLAELVDPDDSLGKVRPYVGYYEQSRFVLIGLLVFFFLFVFLLSARLGSCCSWIGWPMIISSGLLFVVFLGVPSLLDGVSFGDSLSIVFPNSRLLFDSLVVPLLDNLFFYAVSVFSLGLVLVLLSWWFSRSSIVVNKKKKK